MRFSNRASACALALALVCLLTGQAGAQSLDNKGTDFIVGFLPNISAGNTELHLTGDTATMVTVQYPVNSPTFDMTVAVNPGEITIVSLPNSVGMAWPSGAVANNAVRAFGDDEFVAYMIDLAPFSSDAALVLPIDTMNTEYVVMGYTPLFRTETVVVAAFDNTEVTIIPTAALTSGEPAGTPFSVTLDRGLGFKFDSSEDLTGTTVSSDKPVGMTNGNFCVFIPINSGACDHIFEVAQPTQSWGMEALAANLPLRPNGSIYRIVAAQDNTTVTANDSALGTINRGEFLETAILDEDIVFAADKPMFVAQYMVGLASAGTTGDPALGNIVPAAQYLNNYTFSTVGGSQFIRNFVTIIAEVSDIDTLELDDVAIGQAQFAQIGTSSFFSTRVELTDGTHTTSSSSGHGIWVEGYNSADSYMYPGGALFEFINPVGDANPPLCGGQIVNDKGGFRFEGTGTDNLPSEDANSNGVLDDGEDLNGNGEIDEDTGIFFIQLVDGAVNLTLNVEAFVPGDGQVGFEVEQTNEFFPGIGDVRVTDGAGNTCTTTVQLGDFDPFGGIIITPSIFLTLTIDRPDPNTAGVRCIETTDPENPDFGDTPFTFFDGDTVMIDLELMPGDGTHTVCCQFIDFQENLSPPVCQDIELETGQPCNDGDSDGFGFPGNPDCPNGEGQDCDDQNPDVNPNADEICDNGIDDNCDGLTDTQDGESCPIPCDDGDSDGFGSPGDPSCPGGGDDDCDDNDPNVNPEERETCDNGIDDDCDGLIDDDDVEDCDPLLIELDYFRAQVTAQGVSVQWKTVSEIDNAGFRLLRSRDGQTFEAVTPGLIPGAGNELEGASYLKLDRSRQTIGTVYYYLEDVDTEGQVTRHGPTSVEIRRPMAAPLRLKRR